MPAAPHRLAPSSRRSARVAALALLSLSACAGADTARTVRELPPAALLVAVEPVDGSAAAAAGDGLRFSIAADTMQRELAQELRALDVASDVVLTSELGDRKPDVTLRLTTRQPITMAHKGTASYLAAGGLWLVTWVGGLLVEDSTYVVAMDASCRVSANEASVDFPVAGDEVDLSFFERNDFVSLPTLQSLILPPFWTSDQVDTTSEALSHSAVRIAAQRVAERLKQDFEQQAATGMGCGIEIQAPVNGRPVRGTEVPIRLQVSSQQPVEAAFLRVNNGRDEIPLDVAGSRLEGLRRTEVTGIAKGLVAGHSNWVTVHVVVGGLTFSRTLRLPSVAG